MVVKAKYYNVHAIEKVCGVCCKLDACCFKMKSLAERFMSFVTDGEGHQQSRLIAVASTNALSEGEELASSIEHCLLLA